MGRSLRSKAKAFLVNELPLWAFVIIITIVQILYFLERYLYFGTDDAYQLLQRETCGALSVARASGGPLRITCMMIVLPVCRNLLTKVREWLTKVHRVFRVLDKNIPFHRYCAWSILFWTAIHTVAHLQNIWYFEVVSDDPNIPATADWRDGSYQNRYELAFFSLAGITGVLLCFIMFLMYTSSLEFIRRSYFEVFWYVHHNFILFFALLLLHGVAGLVQGIDNNGSFIPVGAQAFKFVTPTLFLYLCERILRFYRACLRTKIVNVVQHPAQTIEIRMRQKGFKPDPGQYIFLQCPNISNLEWHPFTLTSSPQEDYFSVHIRIVGDWTAHLATLFDIHEKQDVKKATIKNISPRITLNVDGPFGTASEDAYHYEIAIFVGAGIGVTPFASLLKSLWYRQMQGLDVKVHRVYFYWLCRERYSFTWFVNLIEALELQMAQYSQEEFLIIKTYLTEKIKIEEARELCEAESTAIVDPITGLKAKTFYGRPNWDKEFADIAQVCHGKEIGVFFCGPKVLSVTLHKMCNKYTTDKTEFFYNKENF